MVKIISIQRAAGRGVVQFIRNNQAEALRFDAQLSDDAVRKLIEAGNGTAAGKGRKNAGNRQG